MNFWLLIARFGIDDVPVAAFATLAECAAAAKVRALPTKDIVGNKVGNDFACWTAVEFKNGKSTGQFRVYDTEDAAA